LPCTPETIIAKDDAGVAFDRCGAHAQPRCGASGLAAVRIVILGTAGSGKSTFARRLGKKLDVPVVCLDDIWQRDWGPSDVPAFRSLIRGAHACEAWISDGNFAAATFDIRLPRATLIVWLECPRHVSAWRAFVRVLGPNSSGHRLRNLPRVLRYIWNFDRINRPLIEKLRMEHGRELPVRRLYTGIEVKTFLDTAPRVLLEARQRGIE
jgi:adenylate kinase family enzyme